MILAWKILGVVAVVTFALCIFTVIFDSGRKGGGDK